MLRKHSTMDTKDIYAVDEWKLLADLDKNKPRDSLFCI